LLYAAHSRIVFPTSPVAQNLEFRLGHRPELDGVRGISILLVLSQHFTPWLTPGGFFGVDIFFVLSGFLITSLLLQEWSLTNSIRLKDFYVRRALRLGPALITYLLVLGTCAFLFLNKESAREIYLGIGLTLAYVSNWVLALNVQAPRGILAITWSLAIEEQFYLIWPLILSRLLIFRLTRGWILGVLALGVVAVGMHRLWLLEAGATITRLYYATDTHADGLLLGCLVGCVLSWNLLPQSTSIRRFMKCAALTATVLIALMVLTITNDNTLLYVGAFSVLSVAIAVVLMTLIAWPMRIATIVLRFKPLGWVGRVSYGLYLWHWPVRGIVFGKSLEPSIKQILVAIALSFTITAFSFYVIEQPFLRLKKRFSHDVRSSPDQTGEQLAMRSVP
jgi:peptidoglycan/LPS O-acetylase OafA/YrhL